MPNKDTNGNIYLIMLGYLMEKHIVIIYCRDQNKFVLIWEDRKITDLPFYPQTFDGPESIFPFLGSPAIYQPCHGCILTSPVGFAKRLVTSQQLIHYSILKNI